MNQKNDVVSVFIPSLGAILLNAEDKKGSPLEEPEVLKIRDDAPCITMERSDAEAMNESRGYKDIDPENCWYDWQMLRRELGRKPDIDPGAKITYVSSDDEEFKKTIKTAQETLGSFRNLIKLNGEENYPLVKTLLAEPNYQAFMWLVIVEVKDDSFIGEIFELPSEFSEFKVGMSIEISDQNIQDWMINDNGTLYGGFSLRYNRSRMSESEKACFDQHIGVKRYA